MGSTQSGAARYADRPSGTNLTACPGSSLATFLVKRPDQLSAAFEKHVHEDLRRDLGGVVLLCNGYTADQVKGWSSKLDCPVMFVGCYGVIGWCVEDKENVEFEEKGRGREFGSPGAPEIKLGITVVVVRKSSKKKKCPVLSFSPETVPKAADGATAHILMGSVTHQATIDKLLTSPDHCVCNGGCCKEVLEWSNGDGQWVDKGFGTITFFVTESTMVNVCISYSVWDTCGLPAFKSEAMEMVQSLPENYAPVFVGSYMCFCRGINTFGCYNKESSLLAELCGKDLPSFGMFCCGEIGNNETQNPNGWNSQTPASENSSYHTFTTCYLVYAEKIAEAPAGGGIRGLCCAPKEEGPIEVIQAVPALQRSHTSGAITVHQSITERDLEFTFEPPATSTYKDFQRSVNFADVAHPAAPVINFWVWDGGMTPEECYSKSKPNPEVDIFLSHSMKQDMRTPVFAMRESNQYTLHKVADIFAGSWGIVSRKVASGEIREDQVMEKLQSLTYWCDTGCVDHSDTAKKMYILKAHLEDFVANAKHVICLLSTHYFTRAWCLYEFCCAVKCCKGRRIDQYLVISTTLLTWFEREAQRVVDSVVNASFENSSCFDSADKKLIQNKINAEFKSVAHFNRLVKFVACALGAKANLCWAVELFPGRFLDWGDAASRCGFPDLAAVLQAVDLKDLRKRAMEAVPDAPGATSAKERIVWLESNFSSDWFIRELEPLVVRELDNACAEDQPSP
ncbi:unnamed protein product [Symbiodinium natans]|uniref:TIR domain-containing protein n=1 Tax=Symbiodinium natans TaxID=878477 RepID=A0A812M9I6_9DINO|nr:unnamed protein product [Symbiodinium natans]